MKRLFLVFLIILFAVTNVYSHGIGPGLVNVTEADGSPDEWVKAIKFTNGTVSVSNSVATVTIAGVSPGSGSMTTVKEGDTGVGDSDIVTLDFQTGFSLVESPDTEVNISLDVTPNAGNATLVVEEDSIQVKYDTTLTEGASGLGVKDDGLTVSKFGDEDWGDVSVSSNSVTLDADVVAAAEMADADHGMVSWSSGAATVEDFALNAAADAGDQDITSVDKLEGYDTAVYIDLGGDTLAEIVADGRVDVTAPNIRIEVDADAYLNIATADGGATTISQTSDGTDQIILGDGSDRVDVASDTWDVTNGAISNVAGLTLTTGNNFTIGSTQWNSGDDIDGTKVADADLGDISAASGSFTLDDDVVAAAEMADADHGMISWTTGVATVEDFALNTVADAGDEDITSIDKLEGIDTAVYIDMGTDGYVDLEADTGIRFNGPLIFANEGELDLPSSDADPDTTGELRHDSTVAGLETGALAWYDGDEIRYIVDLDALPSDDDYVVTYDADADKFYMNSAGAGDVTGVGDCATGACLDGSSDGGQTISLYDGDSHKLTIDAADLTADATLVLGSDTNNITVVNGTASIDIAAGATLNIDTGLQTTTNAGTLAFSAASKTLTIEDDSNIDQDLSSDASPTFAGLDLTEGNITNGGSIAIDAITADGTNVLFGTGAATQLQFRDTALYIASIADGYLDLEADTGIRFNGPVVFANEGEINLPSSDATPDTTGELRHDSTVTGLATGALVWYDGDEARYLVDLDVLPSDDDYVVTYDADNDVFYMSGAGTGDVTGVGNCADGACLDGSSDGGTTISLYDGDSHKLTIDAADLTADATIVLGSDTNNLTMTNGTATVDLAAGVDLNLDVDFTADGQKTTITGAGQANTITLNESFTIGNGTDITITGAGQANTITLNEGLTIGDGNTGTITFSAASKTLTVGNDVTLNQDLQTTDSPTFAAIDTGEGSTEVFAMDQDVQTTDSPTFATVTASTGFALGDGNYIGVTSNERITFATAGTIALLGGNVEVGATSADDTQPHLAIIGDADSDAAGDTDETFKIDLTANATPTSALWEITSTQSAGYTFDKEVTFKNNAAAATFGAVATNADVVLAFDAVTAQGSLTYMEDEDRFDFDNDVALLSDSAVLKFGADADVTLTHVADTALSLNLDLRMPDEQGTVFGSSQDVTIEWGDLASVDDVDNSLTGDGLLISGALDGSDIKIVFENTDSGDGVDLYVKDIHYSGTITDHGTGDAYIELRNNTGGYTATSGYAMYVDAGTWKMYDGTEQEVVFEGTSPTWTGATHDFTGITGNLVLPDNAPSASGGIALVTGNELQWHDGTKVVTIDTTDTTDNYVLKYDNATATFSLEADATGGTPAWDDITDSTGAMAVESASGGEITTFTQSADNTEWLFDFTGAFTTAASPDLFKIIQQTGNTEAVDLVVIQAADTDVTPLRISHNGEDITFKYSAGNEMTIGSGTSVDTIVFSSIGIEVVGLTATGATALSEDVSISLDAADEEISIAQSNAAGTEDVGLIKINDDRTGATATEQSEATIWIDAEGVYAISIVDGSLSVEGDIVPAATDGASLGTDALDFSDLFLASGGVINLASGDVTITHAANTLAFAGATSSYTFDDAVDITGSDGLILENDETITNSVDGTVLINGNLKIGAGGAVDHTIVVDASANDGTITWDEDPGEWDFAAAINSSAAITGTAITGSSVTDGTVTLVGDGTITGVSVGGLPDNIVDNGMMADNAIDSAEITAGAIDLAHLAAGIKSGDDATVITGTAGTSGYAAAWNADGDLVDGINPATKLDTASPSMTGEMTIGDPGGIKLTDDNYIELDATADGMDDDEYNGIVIGGKNCGEGLTQWDTVRIADDADPWHQADANAAGEFPAHGLSVAACTDTNEAIILVRGIVRNEGWTGLTIGGAVYLSETAGGITQTAPSDSGDAVQIVGWALSDSEIYFDFSRPYLEVE